MRVKPFPWKCSKCREHAVFPATVAYRSAIEHDGRSYEIRIPDLEVPRCKNCGALVMIDAANKRISDALREAAGLLLPTEIRQNRERLGLTQKQLAQYLAVAEATLSRWETGAQIQQRVMDRFLRTFFAVPEARSYWGFQQEVTPPINSALLNS